MFADWGSRKLQIRSKNQSPLASTTLRLQRTNLQCSLPSSKSPLSILWIPESLVPLAQSPLLRDLSPSVVLIKGTNLLLKRTALLSFISIHFHQSWYNNLDLRGEIACNLPPFPSSSSYYCYYYYYLLILLILVIIIIIICLFWHSMHFKIIFLLFCLPKCLLYLSFPYQLYIFSLSFKISKESENSTKIKTNKTNK